MLNQDNLLSQWTISVRDKPPINNMWPRAPTNQSYSKSTFKSPCTLKPNLKKKKEFERVFSPLFSSKGIKSPVLATKGCIDPSPYMSEGSSVYKNVKDSCWKDKRLSLNIMPSKWVRNHHDQTPGSDALSDFATKDSVTSSYRKQSKTILYKQKAVKKPKLTDFDKSSNLYMFSQSKWIS